MIYIDNTFRILYTVPVPRPPTYSPEILCPKVLDFIKSYLKQYGRPPTFNDIGKQVGLSHSQVRGVLGKLEFQGKIERTPFVSRGIRLK